VGQAECAWVARWVRRSLVDWFGMQITRIKLTNWRNFRMVDVPLAQRTFLVGPNGSGKSNFLDAIRFLRDIADRMGGLGRAVEDRGGMQAIRSHYATKPRPIQSEKPLAGMLVAKTKPADIAQLVSVFGGDDE
jgi:predicted ATPase